MKRSGWPTHDPTLAVADRPLRSGADPDPITAGSGRCETEHGIGGERLTIEITEGLLIKRIKEARATMRRLAKRGVRL